MNYVFFGTPEFAAIVLEKIINAGFVPEAVVCNPDKPIGRKKIITPPPVKQLVKNEKLEAKIKILQPEKFDSSVISDLLSLNPDFFVIAAYSKILPKKILEIPRFGCIGVHPSLLPKHRGPSPIQTAILNGEEITGTTLYLMDEKIDNGPILISGTLPLTNNDTYKILTVKLAELGANLLINFFKKNESGKIIDSPQEESQATYTKKISTQDAFIEPEEIESAQEKGGETAFKIHRKINALNPEPGTWTVQNEKRMKIIETTLTTDGKLKLKKIQFEGKKETNIND